MEGGLPGCSCSICEEDANSENLPARQEAITRFWDHNFNEVFPPQDFKYISVDCAGTRWSGLVTQRGNLRSAEKLGLTGDGE
jgi:hypothetical protein